MVLSVQGGSAISTAKGGGEGGERTFVGEGCGWSSLHSPVVVKLSVVVLASGSASAGPSGPPLGSQTLAGERTEGRPSSRRDRPSFSEFISIRKLSTVYLMTDNKFAKILTLKILNHFKSSSFLFVFLSLYISLSLSLSIAVGQLALVYEKMFFKFCLL